MDWTSADADAETQQIFVPSSGKVTFGDYFLGNQSHASSSASSSATSSPENESRHGHDHDYGHIETGRSGSGSAGTSLTLESMLATTPSIENYLRYRSKHETPVHTGVFQTRLPARINIRVEPPPSPESKNRTPKPKRGLKRPRNEAFSGDSGNNSTSNEVTIAQPKQTGPVPVPIDESTTTLDDLDETGWAVLLGYEPDIFYDDSSNSIPSPELSPANLTDGLLGANDLENYYFPSS